MNAGVEEADLGPGESDEPGELARQVAEHLGDILEANSREADEADAASQSKFDSDMNKRLWLKAIGNTALAYAGDLSGSFPEKIMVQVRDSQARFLMAAFDRMSRILGSDIEEV